MVLGLVIWRSGGIAFSPGRLSGRGNDQNNAGEQVSNNFRSHADFEKQCDLCHRPLETVMSVLCLDCHQDIARQIQQNDGTHGVIEQVQDCTACHSEHHGQDYDLLTEAIKRFDHTQSGFDLVKHQLDYSAVPLECTACHDRGTGFAFQVKSCTTCHQAHDPVFMEQHNLDFGSNCTACHDGTDRMAHFDHLQTNFPLDGLHTGLGCADCHAQENLTVSADAFSNLPVRCEGCHAGPSSHAGLFEESCESCHSTAEWLPASWQGMPFEHYTLEENIHSAGFSLIHHQQGYDGQALRCVDCHAGMTARSAGQFSEQTCVDCHGQDSTEFIRLHLEQVGPGCLECHDGIDRMDDFYHAEKFILDGAHAGALCLDCHSERYTGTPSACVNCHAEPDIHKGFFGLECQMCHSSEAWSPALMTSHSFPLDHGEQGIVACLTCHPESYTQYTCYNCHEHQPELTIEEHLEEGISRDEISDCARCHPTGEEE